MQDTDKLPPVNQSQFSQAEIKTYYDQFNRQYGSVAKAITLSGIHKQTWHRAMRGEPVKKETLRKISRANMKVISHIQKSQA
jgi:hypothetical protein